MPTEEELNDPYGLKGNGQTVTPEDETPPRQVAQPPVPGGPGKNKPQPRKGGANGQPVGTGDTPPVSQSIAEHEGPRTWNHKEADLLWAEIIEYHRVHQKSIHELSLAFYRVDSTTLYMGWCDVQEVLGDGTNMGPDAALREYVITRFHLPCGVGRPLTYWIHFRRKTSGKILAQGSLPLPSPQELMAIRRAQQQQANAFQGNAQSFYGSPPVPPPMPQPVQYAGPPPGGYYPPGGQPPPPPPTVGAPPDYSREREDISFMRGAYSELIAAAREQRAPAPWATQPPPVALGEPPNEDRIVEKLFAKLAPLVAPAPPPVVQPTLAAPPPVVVERPAPSNPYQAMVERLGLGLMRHVETIASRSMAQAIDRATGVGAPPEVEDEDLEEAPAAQVADPKSSLPYNVVENGAKWDDGSPVMLTPRKDGTGFLGQDLMGLAMANPALLTKFGDPIAKVAVGLTEAVKNATAPKSVRPGVGAPHVQVQPAPAPAPRQELPAPAPAPPSNPQPAMNGAGHNGIGHAPVAPRPGGYPEV